MLRVRHPVAGGVLPDSRVGFEVGDRGKHGGSAELLRAVWAVDGYGGGRVALPGEGYQQRRGLRVGFAAAVRGQPAATTGSTENRAYNVALRDNQSIKKRTRLVSPNFTADLAVVDGDPSPTSTSPSTT